MSSTFFGLTIGASALNSFQVAVNTTANNISNVQTEGYTRQKANMTASEALRVNARYGSTGTGVTVTSITQERNVYYDTKYWENNSSLGYFEKKLYYQNQIQDTFADDSVQKGFTTLFSTMFNSLDTIISQGASDINARNQFLNNAQSLCTYFNNLSTSLTELQEDCNEEIKNAVGNINAIAEKISLLNKEINQIETGTGAVASDLRDERANLLDELSAIVDVDTDEFMVRNSNDDNDLGGTYFRVTINGQLLVDGSEYSRLECVASPTKTNQTDIEGLYSIVWEDTQMDFAATTESANGSLKALFAMRDGDNNDTLRGEASFSDDLESITITDMSITSLNALNIPDSNGTLIIKNRTFEYDSWEAIKDDQGKVASITFNLKEPTTESIALQMEGAAAKCGSGVNSMGVPYYQAQINEFIRNFAEAFNNIERAGENLDGDLADSVFVALNAARDPYNFYEYESGIEGEEGDEDYEAPEYQTVNSIEGSYFRLTAANFAINPAMLKSPGLMALATTVNDGKDAYDLITSLKKLQSDVTLFRGDNASKFLETLISDISVDTQKAEIYYTNYHNLENTIGNQRTSISGVDEDEEALNLIKFQNAYNMASKVISVMSEMYNKLINETGVT